MHPFRSGGRCKPVLPAAAGHRGGGRRQGHGHLFGQGLTPVHHGPALFPAHGGEERLPAQVMVVSAEAAERQHHHPPGTVGRLEEVSVAGSLDVAVLGGHPAMREDGVGRIGLVRPVDVAAAGNGQIMSHFRTAFRDEEVVPAVFLVDMGAFGIAASRSHPNGYSGAEGDSRNGVYLAKGYHIVRIGHHVALPVLKQEGGVDALLLQPDGVAPGAGRVCGSNHEIAHAAHQGGNHIVSSLVVPDGRGVNAQPGGGMLQLQLGRTLQHIPYLFPVLKVPAVENGDAREVVETGVDQVIIFPNSNHGRVRMEARNHRVLQLGFDTCRNNAVPTAGKQQEQHRKNGCNFSNPNHRFGREAPECRWIWPGWRPSSCGRRSGRQRDAGHRHT